MQDYEYILETATDIAERAADIALSYFRQALLIEMKENHTPVTIADKKTEEAIRLELSKAFPGHGILGEELGHQPTSTDFVWTVDPIDGTRSFIRGIPLFGTLLALLEKGEPVIGVMVLPALDETYVAGRGLGAYCNGVQLHMSATKTLESAVISVGDRNCFESAGKGAYLEQLIQRAELCRGYSDCFGHALVARGSVDAMIDPLVSIWDVAPLACIAKEAGGVYFDFDGNETIRSSSFITCNPAMKNQLLNFR